MRRTTILVALAACGGGKAVVDAPAAKDATDEGEVPTAPAPLQAWLAAGRYQAWAAEPAPHPSDGPHGVRVKTFVSPALAASLDAGGDHPRGAASVKELYGDGATVIGWAVSVKLDDDSEDGRRWYWYEVFSTAADAAPAYAGVGLELCADCHSAGQDQVLIEWPFPTR